MFIYPPAFARRRLWITPVQKRLRTTPVNPIICLDSNYNPSSHTRTLQAKFQIRPYGLVSSFCRCCSPTYLPTRQQPPLSVSTRDHDRASSCLVDHFRRYHHPKCKYTFSSSASSSIIADDIEEEEEEEVEEDGAGAASVASEAGATDAASTLTPTVPSQNPPSRLYARQRRKGIRNVAVVAHVDHGKTTLVDQLIRLSVSSLSNASSTTTTTTTATTAATAVPATGSADDTCTTSTTAATDRVMDSGDLEKERGITITSKVTRLVYSSNLLGNNNNNDNDEENLMIINCVDTPGHSDFSAEVDRILSMVDGVVLVVDVVEGPKSQTKYVLSRALALHLQPLVVLNKCDRGHEALSQVDSGETEDQIAQLFATLRSTTHHHHDTASSSSSNNNNHNNNDSSAEQPASSELSYRTLYASTKEGWITEDPMDVFELVEEGSQSQQKRAQCGMKGLIQAIVDDIPEPEIRAYNHKPPPSFSEHATQNDIFDHNNQNSATVFDPFLVKQEPFSLAAVSVGYDSYLGRICTGRIFSGSVSINDPVVLVKREESSSAASGSVAKQRGDSTSTLISGVFVYEGIRRTPLLGTAYAGDVVTLAGVPDSISVGDTVTSKANPVPFAIETPPLAPPTLSMEFGANTGPLAGREGTKIASSQVHDRLMKEADNNVTLQVLKSATDSEKTVVCARGELQLGILVETMRREGFELVISPPRILTKTCPETGKLLEPFEEVVIDVDTEYASTVVNGLSGDRKGVLLETTVSSDGKTHLVFEIPSRGLLGFQSEIASATKGSAVVNHIFIGHQEYVGSLGAGLHRGKLVSNATGKATGYALSSLEARGTLFVEPGDLVYSGMVIGQNAKPGDLEVNPVKTKEKTNIRSVSKDEKVILVPPTRYTVEELIGYMHSDELIEVTPVSVRLRKDILESGARERAARTKNRQLRAAK